MGLFWPSKNDEERYSHDEQEIGERAAKGMWNEDVGGNRARRATVMNRAEDATHPEDSRLWGRI